MALISGTLTDAFGTPLDGELIVTLDTYEVVATSEVRLPRASTYTVSAGVIDIDLVSLDRPYRFTFYEAISPPPDNPVPLFDFRAKVPPVSGLLFSELMPTQIVEDVMDTSAKRVAQLIATDPSLRSLVALQLNPRGAYDPNAMYTRDDVVNYDGGSYLAIRGGYFSGVVPGVTSHWFRLAERGFTGTGTTGNDTAYDPVGWNGETDAPSRNAVRDAIEDVKTIINDLSFAPQDSPNITGSPTVPTPAQSNSSTLIANTQFVWGALSAILDPAAPTQPFAPTVSAGDNTGAIATTQWVHARLANVLTAPGSDTPFIFNGGCSTPALTDDSTSIANTRFVRERTDGINILSYSNNHIRLGTGASPGDGFLTLRWMQHTITNFSTALVNGRHQYTVYVEFPSAVPPYPATMSPPIPVIITPRQPTSGSNDSVIQFISQPIANTREVAVTLVSDVSLSNRDQNLNIISIGYA